MSERHARADRRTIRRAFGSAAMDTITQQHADTATILVALGQLDTKVAELTARVNVFEGMGWRDRLRWLVGRRG